jgi:hypothetical protein
MNEHGYVFLVRMGQDGVRYIDSWMDVSRYISKSYNEYVAAERVKARLRGAKNPNMEEVLREIKSLSTMTLRARFNMMDGPLYVRSDVPITYDEMNTLVASKKNKEYNEFIKRYKFKI